MLKLAKIISNILYYGGFLVACHGIYGLVKNVGEVYEEAGYSKGYCDGLRDSAKIDDSLK